MQKNNCIVNTIPKWIVLFKKDTETFSLRFTNLDNMLVAITRAKGIGYKTKTLLFNGSSVQCNIN